jgi:lauroyl/myristoyl acyltransferase
VLHTSEQSPRGCLMLTYRLFRIAGWLFPRLPLGLLYWAADRAGWVAYHTSEARRRNLTANLRHVLGPQAGDARVRQVAISVCRLWMRNRWTFSCCRRGSEKVRRLVTLQGWENVEWALARERPHYCKYPLWHARHRDPNPGRSRLAAGSPA